MSSKLKIGLLKEGKIPIDRRVPLTPLQARKLTEKYPVEVYVQKSSIRCYSDQEYKAQGIPVVKDLSKCDVLMGVKEVPVNELIPEKIYFFFSHTIKKQSYNRELLQQILNKKIQLVDYECLTNKEGIRIVAFGRYAGIVGAYNAIWAFSKRYRLFKIKRAYQCFDYDDLKKQFKKINLPPVHIVLTGGGRVGKGAMETLLGMGIKRVNPLDFLEKHYQVPVFTQLNSRDYHKHKKDKEFSKEDFYAHPENYDSDFLKYGRKSDILIAGAYWDPRAPKLFRREDILNGSLHLKVIADISCDINGSIPSTKKPTTIEEPIYDYDAEKDRITDLFLDEEHVTVMAVDNLPCELPRDSSKDFGKQLSKQVLPYFFKDDHDQIIKRATIARDGSLTESFSYLQDFVNKKE